MNDKLKFVIYGINQDLLTGDNLVIKGIVQNHNVAKVRVINCLGADKDANGVAIDNFEKTLYSSCDINADGKFDVADVVSLVTKLFSGGVTIVNIQILVNELIK